MRLSAVVHQVLPFAALGGGILVLLMPRFLNYVSRSISSWSAR